MAGLMRSRRSSAATVSGRFRLRGRIVSNPGCRRHGNTTPSETLLIVANAALLPSGPQASRRPNIRRMTNGRYLDTREAAEYLGISHSWLAHARSNGEGPQWIEVPNSRIIRYDVQDLDDWMGSLRVPRRGERTSTAPSKKEHLLPQPGAKRRRGRPTKAESIARRRSSPRP